MNNPMQTFDFNGAGLRTQVVDGMPWFCAADVCRVLGYSNGRDALAKHCRENGVAKRDIRSGNQVRGVNFIDEGNLYRLVMRSRKPEAQRFESWVCDEVLPSIRMTGGYHVIATAPERDLSQLKAETALFECAASLLNMSESGKVTGLQYIGRRHGLDTGFLPGYVVDAAPDATGSAMATSSATSLLERHGSPMTAVHFNASLAHAGLIEPKWRARRAGGTVKKYWCITAAGLQYGKNLTSPANPRETAPHWYDDRFSELLAVLRERAA